MLENVTFTVQQKVVNTSFDSIQNTFVRTVIEKNGEDGKDFKFEDFTPEQLEALQVVLELTKEAIEEALEYTPDTKNEVISIAVSAPGADIAPGDTDSFLAPYDFTLVNFFVGADEAPSGSSALFDLKKNTISVTSSKAVIDSGETSSLTGTAPTLTGDLLFPKGTLITPNIFQVGALETGKSIKFYLEILKS